MKKSLEIFKLIFKLWVRGIKKALNTNLKIFTALFLTGLVVIIATMAGYKLTSSTLNAFLNGDMRSLYLLTIAIFLNSTIMVFIFFICFKSITPEQNQFAMQLNWFPLKVYERSLGYYTPIIVIIGFLVLFIDAVVLIPSFISTKLGFFTSVLFFIFLMLQILFTSFLMCLSYNLFNFIISKLKLPFKKFITLFLLVIGSCFYIISSFSTKNLIGSYMKFDYNLSYFIAPLFLDSNKNSNYSDANILLISFVFLIAFILSFLSFFISETLQERNSSKFLWFIPIPKNNRFVSIIIKEIKTQCRNEENVLNFLILMVIGLFLRFKIDVVPFRAVIAFLLSGVCGIVALNSFGNEQSYFAIYKIFRIRPLEVMLSKLLGLLILALANFLFLSIVILNLPFDPHNLIKNLALLINSTIVFYILGLLVPVERKSPYMGMFSFSLLIFALLPIAFILMYILPGLPGFVIPVLVVGFEIMICAILYYVTNWRFTNG